MKWFKKLFNIECSHSFDLDVREMQSATGLQRHSAWVCEKCGKVDQDSIVRGSGFPILSEKFHNQQKINY